uniref:CSON001847 protein n=1 Tax=Culicoides sonorensis TaxID=179676 RepID=A0A336MVB6_CULSO
MPEVVDAVQAKDSTDTETKEVKNLNSHLTDLQKDILDAIAKKDLTRLKQNLVELKTSIDYYDDTGMTPLQHAAFKGDKLAVELILDRGANVNSTRHQYDYSTLHFGALSANPDVCLLLLLAGANPVAVNSVQRTPAQMAAFVGNKTVVQTINNFIPKSEIDYYTKCHDQQTEPYLPLILADNFHKLVMITNLHPVKIALNVQKYPLFCENLPKIKKVLQLLAEKQMKRRDEVNEVHAFKFHYLSWIIGELQRAKEHAQQRKDSENQEDKEKKSDFIELFTKKVLKPAKDNQKDYLEITIRDLVREFPWRECTVFKQIVAQLVSPQNTLAAFDILKQSIMGHNVFADQTVYCDACNEENPTKKCSKCKTVQYCDRECQRLHWFIHKKTCGKVGAVEKESDKEKTSKGPIDVSELQGVLQQMKGV